MRKKVNRENREKCFKCFICNKAFKGEAITIRVINDKWCHPMCAYSMEKMTLKEETI